MFAPIQKLVVFAVIAACLSSVPTQAQSPAVQPQPIVPASVEVGKPFPIILLPRMDNGQPDTLVNYRGQKLIMHIFASW